MVHNIRKGRAIKCIDARYKRTLQTGVTDGRFRQGIRDGRYSQALETDVLDRHLKTGVLDRQYKRTY